MPVVGTKVDVPKKSLQKKGRNKPKSKVKPGPTKKNLTNTKIPTVVNRVAVKSTDLNSLSSENLSSLRWDFTLSDPVLEDDRIEQYKELRRQRYIHAQQQAMQNLIEKKNVKHAKE